MIRVYKFPIQVKGQGINVPVLQPCLSSRLSVFVVNPDRIFVRVSVNFLCFPAAFLALSLLPICVHLARSLLEDVGPSWALVCQPPRLRMSGYIWSSVLASARALLPTLKAGNR